MTAEEQFKQYADIWIENGINNVVPIIGSGVNMQAANMEGKHQGLNWDTLITEIIRESGISMSDTKHFPNSFIRKWESVLRIFALETIGYQPHVAENKLQKKVQGILKNYEQNCKDYGLYKAIVDSGFKDIISLNFDRCTALAGKANSIQSIADKTTKDNTTLYRHSLINHGENQTKIWYPHGDTKRLDTIKLGVRKYGLYVNWIESLRGAYMKSWYEHDDIYCRYNQRSWIPPNVWDDKVRNGAASPSWVNVFKSAPLLFIGCSLLPDEWPLWYLLNQRARQTAYLDQKNSPDDRPATIVLSAGKNIPTHLANEPEYIVNIHFESYDRMWKAVMDFFEEGKKQNLQTI